MKKLKNNKSNDYKYLKLFISIWFIFFIVLGIAFSGFTSNLKAEGTALIQSHIYDYVYITKATISGNSGASSINYSFQDHEIKASISAPSCNNYVTYKLDIVNTTPYKAYITKAGLASAVNGNGNPSNSFSAEFIDGDTNSAVVTNTTYINPHSTKVIYVKMKNNCSGSDTSGIVTANFEYSLYKYFDLTVNCTSPSGADISITTSEGTFTGTGTLTHRVHEGDTASYSVSKHHYYTKTGSYTMGTEDHTINVTLSEDPRRDVTFNTTPSSATIVVKDSSGNIVMPDTTGGKTYTLNKGQSYSYTVTDPEYYDSSGTYTVTDSDGQKVNVTLQERPWITGTIANTNRTTAATKTDTNYHAGYYLVQAWGGKGANGKDSKSGTGGATGYVYGVVYVPYNSSIFATAGGNGDKGDNDMPGGANGGGTSGSDSTNYKGGSGGGYSAFAVGATSISESTINSKNVKLIAAGSGGGSGSGGIAGNQSSGDGGAGGTLSSTASSISVGTVFHGTDGTSKKRKGQGTAGTTTPGIATESGSDGTMLAGGNGAGRGGGGGAGYYGGGAGSGYYTGLTSSTNYGPGGGGGGSSFVASDVQYSGLSSNITSKLVGSNPSSTGGAIIITWIGKTL